MHQYKESKTKTLNSKLNCSSKTSNCSTSWFNASNCKPLL